MFQNQIPQGVVPQNHNFLPNQMNPSGPMQIANQGQKGQQGTSILPQKPSPTVTNFQVSVFLVCNLCLVYKTLHKLLMLKVDCMLWLII